MLSSTEMTMNVTSKSTIAHILDVERHCISTRLATDRERVPLDPKSVCRRVKLKEGREEETYWSRKKKKEDVRKRDQLR